MRIEVPGSRLSLSNSTGLAIVAAADVSSAAAAADPKDHPPDLDRQPCVPALIICN